MGAKIKSEILYTLPFCKQHKITKSNLNKFSLNGYLPTEEVNYIDVVVASKKVINRYHNKLCSLAPVNCEVEALFYVYADTVLLPQIDELSSPLQTLTLNLLKNPSASKDYINSAYSVIPDCYK